MLKSHCVMHDGLVEKLSSSNFLSAKYNLKTSEQLSDDIGILLYIVNVTVTSEQLVTLQTE